MSQLSPITGLPLATGLTGEPYMERRRFKQVQSPKDRLAAFSEEARERASHFPPGVERDNLLRRAREAANAQHVDDSASSPGFQTPK